MILFCFGFNLYNEAYLIGSSQMTFTFRTFLMHTHFYIVYNIEREDKCVTKFDYKIYLISFVLPFML